MSPQNTPPSSVPTHTFPATSRARATTKDPGKELPQAPITEIETAEHTESKYSPAYLPPFRLWFSFGIGEPYLHYFHPAKNSSNRYEHNNAFSEKDAIGKTINFLLYRELV